MSENALTVKEMASSKAIATQTRGNYVVKTGNADVTLKRDTDFGVIPKTKKPSLFKSGAEKIVLGYKLFQRYTIESKIEDINTGFFYYAFKCALCGIVDGVEYEITSGYGSANTNEKSNGFAGAYDSANKTIKMAKKRALVDAALTIGGLSDLFAQDMENEDYINTNKQELLVTDNDDAPLTSKQIQRLYAIAGEHGLKQQDAKRKLVSLGFASTKDIKQKDYDHVCEAMAVKEG